MRLNFKYGIPAILIGGLLGTLFLIQMMGKPRGGRKKRDAVQASVDPNTTDALDFWLGDWDVRVRAPRREEDLEDEERQAKSVASVVLEKLVGDWALVPGSTLEGVQSPLRSMVPEVENEIASERQQTWSDGLGNIWKGKPCTGKEPMRLETTTMMGKTEVVLYMFFKTDAKRDQAFDFAFAFAIRGMKTWKMLSEVKYSRSGLGGEPESTE